MARWGWNLTEKAFEIPEGHLLAVIFKNSQGNYATVYGLVRVADYILANPSQIGVIDGAKMFHRHKHELKSVIPKNEMAVIEDVSKFGLENPGWVIIVTGEDPHATK